MALGLVGERATMSLVANGGTLTGRYADVFGAQRRDLGTGISKEST